ncbi:MAG TPA: hypothetical protein VG826_24535 [Pirellulales bacterium]|nr:hypothetical protein [Pirellulales bacterium]
MPIGRKFLPFAWLAAVVFSQMAAAAEDSFYRVPLADLKLAEGELPDEGEYRPWRSWERVQAMQPYAVLDGEGEAYIEFQTVRRGWAATPSMLRSEGAVVARAPAGRDLSGFLYLPKADYTGMVKLRFTIPMSAAMKESEAFYRAKQQHYQELLDRGLPGAAWFRHQARSARRKLRADEAGQILDALPPGSRDVGDTFDLFSGGRAIRENLQLDRELRLAGKTDEMVDVGSIKGITVAEIDWKPLLAEVAPRLDPLARSVPADQHAVFFPSFSAAVDLADEMSRQATPFSRLILARSEDELVRERYERQLCLSLSTVARVIGQKMVASVVLTGSDPYFFTGTDVAVLLETAQPAALKTLLLGRATAAAGQEVGAKAVSGETEGLVWSGFVSPDRRVCCYVAQLDGAVLVTNSTAQLARLGQVRRGDAPALATLDEYKFFRRRYPLGEGDETALVFLSDAAIRRWCGPKWRIAASRRLRDAAVMSELEADFLDDLVNGKVEEGPIHTDLPLAGTGELRLGPHGVRSSTDGTLEFQTPIAEMALDRVTKAEADAYVRWRDGYQSNWRWAFDPIALRLSVDARRLSADLTVMPLIFGSEYRSFIEVARGAQIKPTSGDPHQALAHFILALNRESQQLRAGANFAEGMVRVKVLDWLGEWVSVYVDDDNEYWQGLAKSADPEQAMQYASAHLDRLPVGVHVAVRDSLKLTAFLAGLRAWVEQTAPRMTDWEALTYRDEPYVKVGPSERARGEIPPNVGQPNLYYSFSADGLVLSLNEDLLKRAIDRQIERREAKKEGKEIRAVSRPWLGSSLCFQFDGRLLALFDAFGGESLRETIQARSWGNLPILNEWRRRYPDRDPVKLHEEFWHTRLVCPGGGEYVWNDEWQTMESTTYGHPGEPKAGPQSSLPLGGTKAGNFGITFEQNGLRARGTIEREEREAEKE